MFRDWIWAVAMFAVVALLGYGARQAIGRVYSGQEAQSLIASLSQSGLYLGSATATASATTLALMLTLIGMVRRADADFDRGIYQSVGRIAKLATASLMISLMLLLLLVFPVGQFDGISAKWYPMFYEVLFATVILTVAVLAATVAILYQTLNTVLRHITPGDDV